MRVVTVFGEHKRRQLNLMVGLQRPEYFGYLINRLTQERINASGNSNQIEEVDEAPSTENTGTKEKKAEGSGTREVPIANQRFHSRRKQAGRSIL